MGASREKRDEMHDGKIISDWASEFIIDDAVLGIT